MNKPAWDDSDPSFIRQQHFDLPRWAGRIGLGESELQEALENGLLASGKRRIRTRDADPAEVSPYVRTRHSVG